MGDPNPSDVDWSVMTNSSSFWRTRKAVQAGPNKLVFRTSKRAIILYAFIILIKVSVVILG